MLGHVDHNELSVRPVARFPNGPVQRADGLHWDIDALYSHALAGLAAALREEPTLAGIGIDSWAVDYTLLTGGRMLGLPFHYRDERTARGVERVHSVVSPEELYAANGLQFLPFNTLYQFAAEGNLDTVDSFLLIPDLLAYWLTGRRVAERTNGSRPGSGMTRSSSASHCRAASSPSWWTRAPRWARCVPRLPRSSGVT